MLSRHNFVFMIVRERQNTDRNTVILTPRVEKKLLSSTAVAGERFWGNKLRTYKTFKHELMTEPYVCAGVMKGTFRRDFH